MSEQDIIREALDRYQSGVDADWYNRERDEEDRRFYRGGSDQWDAASKTARNGRPTITVNRLPQFVKQVTGEMRQNKPSIRVLPVDDKTDPQLAEVYTAIIRHIENLSDAHRVYAKAGEQSVIGGIGWFRVNTDYLSDSSFEQEIKIERIRNPLSVVFDPAAVEQSRCDAHWMFISELKTEEEFRREYPDANLTGFPEDEVYTEWKRGEYIRVAEYWTREAYPRELLLLSDGSTRYGDELDEQTALMLEQSGIAIVRKRKVDGYKVRWRKMTGLEVLEEGEWAGKYIPIIPVVGEEVEAGDDVFRHGLIHHAKDSQRSYNFSRSAMIEHIASQPKAPYIATTEMVKNYKAQWEGLNQGNPPVLIYDPDPQAPGMKPQRESPPTFAGAWYQEAQVADGDMKATTGIYDASLGKQSNETSGRAILARDQQGETSTYVYVDNLSAAIHHCGRILIDLIPHIYSDERVIRIMGEDNSLEGFAAINAQLPDGTRFNDISVGQFDLEVVTGPAFATKRLEAADKMMQLVQAVPQIGQVGADMIVRALDMPYGDKLADRLAFALLPPGLDPEVDEKRQASQPNQGQPNPMQMLELAGKQAEIAEKEAKTEETRSKTTYNLARAASEESAIQAMVAQIVQQEMLKAGLLVGMGDGP